MTTVCASIGFPSLRDRTRRRLAVVVLRLPWAGTADAAEVGFTQNALLRVHGAESNASALGGGHGRERRRYRGPEFAVIRPCRAAATPTTARWRVAELSRR